MAASRALAVAAAVCALAACGGGDESDAAADEYRAFADAAAERDTDRVWSLLSQRNRRAATRNQIDAAAASLQRDYKLVAGGAVVLDVELGERAVLVALRGDKEPRPAAAAAILRKEGDAWKVQLSEVDLGIGENPLDFTVNARGDIRVRAWGDNAPAAVQEVEPTYARTFSVGVPEGLPSGVHTAVVFVRVGDKTGAMGRLLEQ